MAPYNYLGIKFFETMSKIIFKLSIFIFLLNLYSTSSYAENLKYSDITLDHYLEIVRENNSTISSAKLDVQTADANIKAQALYNFSPSISYSRGSWINQVPYAPYNQPQSNTYSFNFNLEALGKRSAREELARTQRDASELQLQSSVATLEIAAIDAYIDALRLCLVERTYEQALSKLSQLGSKDVLESPLVKNIKNKIKATQKDLMYSSLNLLNYSGDAIHNLPYPQGSLRYPAQNYDVEQLIAEGQSNRRDLKNLQASINVAEKNIVLTNENRNVDLSTYVAQTRTPQYNDSGLTYTTQNSISAGVTIPIPASNYLQSADLVKSSNQKLQYEMQLRDLKSQIRVQILQAYLQYEEAKTLLLSSDAAYRDALKKTYKSKIQQIAELRDVQGALLDAQTNHLKALIFLWRQSGNYSVPNL